MNGQNGRIQQPKSSNRQLTEFVADLEQLRREAGQPSLRKMSETGHYSHTALASVLSGTRLPSEELTLAFVRSCGGDKDAWQARWHRENALINGVDLIEAQPVTQQSRVPRWGLAAVLAALATITVVALVAGTGSFRSRRAEGPAVPPVASPAAQDGTDPQEQRCQLDAVNAQTVQIPDPNPAQPSYGSLTLRYSPRCRAAWPLFVSTARVPTGAMIRLRITRPSDGAASEFDYPFMVRSQVYSVFGNVLQTGKGCVAVAIEIGAVNDRGLLATADTPCVQLGSKR